MKNASGAVKRKVNEIFGNTLREAEKKELCTLIYYPEEKIQLVKAREKDLDDWYLITLNQLVKVCQNVSSKYTRSKVRKSLPAEFSYNIPDTLPKSIFIILKATKPTRTVGIIVRPAPKAIQSNPSGRKTVSKK